VGIEAQSLARGEGSNGDDVPEIFGNDVGDEKVDLVASVRGFPSGGLHAVAGFGVALGGFDLDAEESVAEGEDEVVAFAVSPGFGDGKAEAGSFGEEGGFGNFSAAFAGGDADGLDLKQLWRWLEGRGICGTRSALVGWRTSQSSVGDGRGQTRECVGEMRTRRLRAD